MVSRDYTISTATIQNGPIVGRSGLNFAYAEFDFRGRSVSNSLVIQMVGVPNGARILDLWVTFYNRTDGSFAVGDASLSNRYITALSLTANGQTNFLNNAAGAGYKISLTGSIRQFTPITIYTPETMASASTTGCVHMGVYYFMDPNVS